VRKHASRPGNQVFAVTGLPSSLRDDQADRMRRYLLSMGIRTVSFVLAVIALTVLHWTLVGWGLVIAAVVLPYIAVVLANAKRPRGRSDLGPMGPDRRAAGQIAPPRPDEDPKPRP